jgi:Domain of unknown function (DUF4232)
MGEILRRARRPLTLAVIGICAVGCGSSGASGGPTTVTRTATVASPTTAGGAPSHTSGATSTAAPPVHTSGATSTAPSQSAPAECATADLSARLSHGNGAAGTSYYQLELRNSSSTMCGERGYAGVSLLDSSGRQVGAAAARTGGSEPSVSLAPGQIAYATLAVAEAGDFPSSCTLVNTVKLRIYPPDQTASLTIPFHSQGCANSADKLLRIAPLRSSPAK